MIETTYALTANDVKALRQADRISFHHRPSEGSCIVATKTVRDRGPFDDRERKYEIRVNASFSGKFADSQVSPENACCFEMEHNANYSEEWQTIAQFLRPEDEITLRWSADGFRNGYVEKALCQHDNAYGMELHADSLYLKVRRKDKRFSFLLDVSICPNNTARMIRPK